MRLTAGELRRRSQRLQRRLATCDLCPRRCGVDRGAGERGFCGVGTAAPVAAAVAHFGEEPPISGTRGAGTIFFAGCNLRCCYCQNRQISRWTGARTSPARIRELTAPELAAEMLRLQEAGCHNIELVTPSHVVPQIVAALALAAEEGLDLPVVYNSGGYDTVDVLRELEGVIDVFLPDLKYSDSETAEQLSAAADYWAVARAAVGEMVRQAGALELDAAGIARRGVIVRHLALPEDLAGSREVLSFLAGLDPAPAVALMAQFYPIAECDHSQLQRAITTQEWAAVVAELEALDLTGWTQAPSVNRSYRPDFSRADPFVG
ncbi:MAG: radical SAM protein [Candidatus Eisenbacteria sp.]|nr:radical SAM protein [Candidatus Eisenbacteria bacterium]